MAAECLRGPFFQYKFREVATITPCTSDVVWVNQRYTPIDLRSTAPVQRKKFIVTAKGQHAVEDTWRHDVEPPSEVFSRDKEELRLLPSSHATRCEEWSTLRQILPSRGTVTITTPARWGTAGPPNKMHFKREPATRFPHINSPMTG